MFKKSLKGRILLLAAFIAAVLLTNCSKTKDQSVKDTPRTAKISEQIESDRPVEKATFAAGCFWHVEYAFGRVPGVVSTTVGYTGGNTDNPSYKQVCSDRTGHAEAVEVTFDSNEISYSGLLEIFWNLHDPTQLNRQGPDVGSQYRSAIFYHSDEQKQAALETKAKLETANIFSKPIVTEIVPAGEFYRAEDYHQKYFEKHGVVCSPAK